MFQTFTACPTGQGSLFGRRAHRCSWAAGPTELDSSWSKQAEIQCRQGRRMILGISGKQFFPHTPQLAFMWVWHVCPYVGCTSQSHPPPLALSHQPPHQRLKYQAYDLFPHGLSLCTNTSSNNATGLYSLFVIISLFTRRRWRCRPVGKK